MTNREYQEYLKTPQWERTAEIAKVLANQRCQICNHEGPAGLEAHHRSYRHIMTPSEFLDLVVLCGRCHALYEKYQRMLQPELHLYRVLNLTITLSAETQEGQGLIFGLLGVAGENPGEDGVSFYTPEEIAEGNPRGLFFPNRTKISKRLLQKMNNLYQQNEKISWVSITSCLPNPRPQPNLLTLALQDREKKKTKPILVHSRKM